MCDSVWVYVCVRTFCVCLYTYVCENIKHVYKFRYILCTCISFCIFADDDIADIQTNFTSNRSTLPSMFIATPTDRHASLVSQHHPDMPILAHLQNVARKAYSVLSEQLKSPNISCEGAVSPSSDVKVGVEFTRSKFHS